MTRIARMMMVAAFGVALSGSAKATFIIDNFILPPAGGQTAQDTTLSGSTLNDGSYNGLSGLNSASVVGGVRELLAVKTGGNSNTTFPVTVQAGSDGGAAAQFDEQGTLNGALGYGVFHYDGVANELTTNAGQLKTTGLNVDLTEGGKNNSFLIGGLSITGNGLSITVTISTTGGTRTFTHAPLINGTTTDVFIPFASFAGSGSFSSVTAIDVQVNSTVQGSDLSFTLLAAGNPAPVPPTLVAGLAMGGLTLVGGAIRRIRKA